MVEELFRAIDAKDAEGFAAFLAPECVFQFGNAPEVVGVANIRSYVGSFFESVAGVEHLLEASWDVPGAVVCHGSVKYRRMDGTVLQVPFANVLRTGPSGISDYRIFVDASQLYT